MFSGGEDGVLIFYEVKERGGMGAKKE